jgi:excisionase family DNA binding protein
MYYQSYEGSGPSKTTAIVFGNGNPSSVARQLLSKRELAPVLGVSVRTIDNWIAQRRIPYVRLSARLIRFDLERVKGALARYEVKEVGRRL